MGVTQRPRKTWERRKPPTQPGATSLVPVSGVPSADFSNARQGSARRHAAVWVLTSPVPALQAAAAALASEQAPQRL